MALKGNLREFSLVQLFNLINLAKKSGALYIETAGQSARLVFRDGKLIYAATGMEHVPLVRMMSRAKMIPSSLAASLGERYKTLSDKELGIHLINAGYLSQEQIFAGIESHLKDTLRGLFGWTDASFHFEMGELPPDGVIPVRVDLESIIMEASRKLHELEDLKSEIPSLEMALKFSERPGLNIRNVNLNAEEWRVVSYVNPKNTIRQIAGAAKLDELQVRKVVFDLMQAGLVELVRPNGSTPIPTGRTAPLMRDPAEQISLVNRVINRIKSI